MDEIFYENISIFNENEKIFSPNDSVNYSLEEFETKPQTNFIEKLGGNLVEELKSGNLLYELKNEKNIVIDKENKTSILFQDLNSYSNHNDPESNDKIFQNVLFNSNNKQIDEDENSNYIFFGARDEEEIKEISCKKKKGKKKTVDNGRDTHGKDSFDNMRNNLKINFFNFIIDFFNCFIKKNFPKDLETFKQINYKDKTKKTKKSLYEQLNMKMNEILSLPIQNNYKKYATNWNQLLMNKIEKKIKCKKYQCYEYLFSMSLSEFYKTIYLSNEKKELTNEFGIEDNFFIDSIKQLNENEDYINKYITMASNLLKFAGIEERNLNLKHFNEIIKYNDNINNKYSTDNVNKNQFLEKKRF